MFDIFKFVERILGLVTKPIFYDIPEETSNRRMQMHMYALAINILI